MWTAEKITFTVCPWGQTEQISGCAVHGVHTELEGSYLAESDLQRPFINESCRSGGPGSSPSRGSFWRLSSISAYGNRYNFLDEQWNTVITQCNKILIFLWIKINKSLIIMLQAVLICTNTQGNSPQWLLPLGNYMQRKAFEIVNGWSMSNNIFLSQVLHCLTQPPSKISWKCLLSILDLN